MISDETRLTRPSQSIFLQTLCPQPEGETLLNTRLCFLSSEDSRTEVQNQVPTKKPCRARGAGTCAWVARVDTARGRDPAEATRYNRTTRFQTRFQAKEATAA